jgi:hypothetical protein
VIINSLQSFNQLIDQIESAPTLKFAHRQLACISKLVFFCGVQPPEIVKLLIRDVVDTGGSIIMDIDKFEKPIFLTDEVARSIARHIDGMGKGNPTLVKRLSPLFPAYPNTRKLARHWKKFGTSYLEIHHAGIHHFYQTKLAAGLPKGRIYKEGGRQKRVTPRQFLAVALNSKIPAGRSVDDRCIHDIMELMEQAERLDKTEPGAKIKANRILAQFDDAVRKIRSDKLREEYGRLRSDLTGDLKGIL